MHDAELVLEELEAGDDALGDAREHELGDVAAREEVERAGVHELHAEVDARL